MPRLLPVLALLAVSARARAEPPPPAGHPRVLVVVAHPDDESCFSATIYQITHDVGGAVDQLVITNGEGGYRYSLLAESYYRAPLTDEAVGRARLPEIRKREALESGKILGITDHFFLGERDVRYTRDVDEVLTRHWNAASVGTEVKRRLEAGNYDFVLTLFPSADTHGAHKAAALIALNSVAGMRGAKPAVLACQDSAVRSSATLDWSGFRSATHPYTVGPERYSVDRAVKFGFKDALSYQIIASWVIAAHKSQGAFQMDAGRYDREEFALLDPSPSSAGKADRLFRALGESAARPPGYPRRTPPAQ